MRIIYRSIAERITAIIEDNYRVQGEHTIKTILLEPEEAAQLLNELIGTHYKPPTSFPYKYMGVYIDIEKY